MGFKAKKMAVFELLSEINEPMGLNDLLKRLGEDYAERSVRRWLAEMVQEGKVETLGRKKGTLYQVNTKNSGIQKGHFSLESQKIVELVRHPIYERNPAAYVEEWLDNYQPNKTFYIPKKLREQLFRAGKRSKSEEPAGTYAQQIFNRLLIDLSYNSSRLEGNTYSLLETEKLILEGETAHGKLEEEKIMILNHKEAIRYLVDNAPRLSVSFETICTLHYLLSDGLVAARYAGKIRDHAVRIGGSTYIPFEDPKRLKFQMERIVEKAREIEDPYEQSFFVLVHLSYLQPFTDVNKRTARLSSNIALVNNNLVPLSFNDVERDDYISAIIAIYELQDVRPLVDLYVFSYLRTCNLYDSTVKAVGFDEVRVRYRQKRRTMIRDIILKRLTGDPLKKYLAAEVSKLIPAKDRKAFLEDVAEDLQAMDTSRIAGLGVTPKQLELWQKKYQSVKF